MSEVIKKKKDLEFGESSFFCLFFTFSQFFQILVLFLQLKISNIAMWMKWFKITYSERMCIFELVSACSPWLRKAAQIPDRSEELKKKKQRENTKNKKN